MQQLRFVTQRLELVALYPELARAAVDNRIQLAQLLNARVPEEFPPEIMADVMEIFAQTLEADPGLVGWWGWYLVLNEFDLERVLIGCAGFNGYPDAEGNLLLGYSVLDAYQGKGYATEAVGGLLHWAFEQPQVMGVMAETFPNHIASIRVMEKNGMGKLGEGSDSGTVRYGIGRS